MPRVMSFRSALVEVVYLVGYLSGVIAGFAYREFNATSGLVLNGDAATTSCIYVQELSYSPRYGANDESASLGPVQRHQVDAVVFEATNTDVESNNEHISLKKATIGHRTEHRSLPATLCPMRLRLTGSKPHQLSSVWYAEPVPIFQGFETGFRFQITDQSKRCIEARSKRNDLHLYQSCSVHGGDGFAFVLHGNGNGSGALGHKSESVTGRQSYLGFEGLENSLAVEFDTWYNPEFGDMFYDHITIYSKGLEANSMLEDARLSSSVLHDLGDGLIHSVKIRYYPEVKLEYLPFMSPSSAATAFMKDLSEKRRIGTLAIFVDSGHESDTPLIAIPINLATALKVPKDLAYMGFTSSTGQAWQKHDILDWYCCSMVHMLLPI
uniref:Uncharacterized protein AlNc14C28G2670 n=1 Tax=Albugo laibachii Nc14 TaxID=890382 RepID=F0W741_9STRA|nr:conserved hypothetical protein [Albugo laibachii Nc14]|eukprot:CCA16940.1 conserved hypothetical protein [Albugo laibachii Nc14]